MADPQYGNNDLITRHMTSSARNADLKGEIFRRTFCYLNLIVIAYILSTFGCSRPQKTKKARDPFLKSPGNLPKKIKTLASCARVLHKTLNVFISRCCFVEDGKEMY